MKNPAESLGKIIAGVENPRDMFHDNLFLGNPFLNCKTLNLDMNASSNFYNNERALKGLQSNTM